MNYDIIKLFNLEDIIMLFQQNHTLITLLANKYVLLF